MRILFKLTSRERPEKFKITLLSIINNLSDGSDHFLLVSIDADDPNKEAYQAIWKELDEQDLLPQGIIQAGQSDNKVFAINRDVSHTLGWDWEILVNVSDDQVFIKKDFDKDIIQSFEMSSEGAVTQYDLDRFVHFPDGYVHDRQASMSIMGRPYYQTKGYIYHPDYISLWCDTEALDVAKAEGKWIYVNKAIFRHEHPANNRAIKTDELLRYTQSFYHIDGATFQKRKAAGFPKECMLSDHQISL